LWGEAYCHQSVGSWAYVCRCAGVPHTHKVSVGGCSCRGDVCPCVGMSVGVGVSVCLWCGRGCKRGVGVSLCGGVGVRDACLWSVGCEQ
jgi:hypothetical protein